MPNKDLFDKYYIDLRLRILNEHDYQSYISFLEKFRRFLGDSKPSVDKAKEFLVQYHDRAVNTQSKYAIMLKGFMKYYGEPADDLRVKRRTILPQVVEDAEISRFLEAVSTKQSHKKTIDRDILLFHLYLNTGMRRGELADLKVKHIHSTFIMVIKGKGEKDRRIPLLPDTASRLHNYVRNRGPEESVFGLKAASITNKVRTFALKAGVKDIHTHSFRHKYATELISRGANTVAVKQLLGHASLNTTQAYVAITDRDLDDAVSVLSRSPLGDKDNRLDTIIEKLNSVTVTVCGNELSPEAIFYQLRGNLAEGIRTNEVLKAVVEHFGGSIVGESSESCFAVFHDFSLLNLVEMQLRREGLRIPYDQKYWVLTERGKEVIRYIHETKQE